MSKLLAKVLLALSFCAAIILVGCGSNQPKSQSPVNEPSKVGAPISSQQYLAQARKASSPERERLTLKAVEVMIANKNFHRARQQLVAIDNDALPDDLYLEHTLLLSEVAMHEGSWLMAQGILTSDRLKGQWKTMPQSKQAALREKRALTFAAIGDTQASINERLILSSLLTNQQKIQENQEAIWQDLMRTPNEELAALAQRETKPVLRGWYQLATLAKNNEADLATQYRDLEQWRKAYPRHPANTNLPADLQLLRTLISNQPKKVALLLPQNGRLSKAGDAIRDGFYAAYYHAIDERQSVPEVIQIDSSADIQLAYQQALEQGADLVIGPLDREKVLELALLPERPVPILSLNYTEESEATGNLVQFGLAIEDEARQVARQTFLEGHRYALVMIPPHDWSERSAKAFAQEFTSLGGTVVGDIRFGTSSDYSQIIKAALQLEQSQARINEVKRIFGDSLNSTVRRRKDVDFIFLVADANQARQVKPMLAYHYGGNIPVYATSQVYSGVQDEKGNGDLNGIRFTTLPWLLDNRNPLKKDIDQHAQSSAVYSRLHALGADAFKLYPRLPQLAQVSDLSIIGGTGALKLLANGRIEREQLWARFRNGKVQMLPMVTVNEN